jgi:hypothetical protein
MRLQGSSRPSAAPLPDSPRIPAITRETISRNTAIFAFITGAVAATLAVLFTSSKGAVARKNLADLGGRMKGKAKLLAGRGARSWKASKDDPAEAHPASGQDPRGKAAGTWQDIMDRTEAMATEARHTASDIASECKS